jgi:hypothetical protein
MWAKLLASLVAELLAKASGPVLAWWRERQARAKYAADRKAIRDAVADAAKKP